MSRGRQVPQGLTHADSAAAPDWAWPPTEDDLDAVHRIDVGAVVRAGDRAGAASPAVPRVEETGLAPSVSPDISSVWLTQATVVRPRRLLMVLPLAAAASVMVALSSWMEVRVPTSTPARRSIAAPTRNAAPQVAAAASRAVTDGAVRRVLVEVDRDTRSPALPPGAGDAAPRPTAAQPEAAIAHEPPSPDAMAWASSSDPAPQSVVVPELHVPTLSLAVADAARPAGPTGAVEVVPAPAAIMPSRPLEAAPIVVRSEEPSIRDVLGRYGTAYSRLDATAARAVWPAVDVRALGRAFEALRSQQVRFSDCRVTVTGDVADATCTGTATWVPRVGDPTPRVEAREWRFHLTRDDRADWRIQTVRSR